MGGRLSLATHWFDLGPSTATRKHTMVGIKYIKEGGGKDIIKQITIQENFREGKIAARGLAPWPPCCGPAWTPLV